MFARPRFARRLTNVPSDKMGDGGGLGGAGDAASLRSVFAYSVRADLNVAIRCQRLDAGRLGDEFGDHEFWRDAGVWRHGPFGRHQDGGPRPLDDQYSV